jgi:predicted transcriptional regulator
MPPKQSTTLTEAELRLMRILWHQGESSVSELASALSGRVPLAYTTVMTTMKVLEVKGYASHRKEGRAFLYSAIVEEEQANESAVQHILGRFFNGSRERLLLSLLGDERITASELKKLKKRVAEAKR